MARAIGRDLCDALTRLGHLIGRSRQRRLTRPRFRSRESLPAPLQSDERGPRPGLSVVAGLATGFAGTAPPSRPDVSPRLLDPIS